MIFVLILIIIGAGLELLGVSIVLPLVDLGMNSNAMQENRICSWIVNMTGNTNTTSILLILIVGMIMIYIGKNLFLAYSNSVSFRFSMNVRRSLATRLMTTYMRQPYFFFLKNNSAELIRSVNVDTMQFYEMLSNVFLVISNGLVAICLLIFLSVTNWIMTLSVLILLGLCVGTVFLKIRSVTRALGKRNQIVSSDLIQMLQQSFEGIKEIKVLSREHFFIDQYSETYRESANISRKFNLASILPKYLIETICIIAILGFLAVNVIINGNYMEIVPQIAVFAVAAFRLLPSVNALYMYSNTIVYNLASVDLVYHDLKEAEKLDILYNSNEKDDNTHLQFKECIELKDITFRYDNAQDNVLNHISFTVIKGQSVALVGASGGGKTTLADIFLGLLQPQEGQVLVDGVDIRKNIHKWTSNIGYIPQIIFLSDDSIRNNIALGITADAIDDNKIWKALEEAQLKEFVLGLEEGLDTKVGERGTRISGGQRQRIGIARALYNDPPILVFDEATSALDNETEKDVMEAIDSLHGVKTMLMIAHRLTTIQNCDVVYEVGNGTVKIQERKK